MGDGGGDVQARAEAHLQDCRRDGLVSLDLCKRK